MFTLSDSVTVSGISYQIRTDFCVILEIFVMLDDPDLTHADKTEALIRMFYVERPPDPETASSLVPYAATVQAPAPQQLSLDGLADTIAGPSPPSATAVTRNPSSASISTASSSPTQ